LLALISLPVWCAIGIADYFYLGSSARTLGGAVMGSVPGHWNQRITINVGYFSLGVARIASSFVHLPPEARAAVNTLNSAEVGVYQLEEPVSQGSYGEAFAAADKAMRRRGWERIVGVSQQNQFVAVYAPRHLRSASNVSICVAVLNDRDFVVVSARGDLQPLLDIAERRLHERGRL